MNKYNITIEDILHQYKVLGEDKTVLTYGDNSNQLASEFKKRDIPCIVLSTVNKIYSDSVYKINCNEINITYQNESKK